MIHRFLFIFALLACVSLSELARTACFDRVETEGLCRKIYKDPSPECNQGQKRAPTPEPVSMDVSVQRDVYIFNQYSSFPSVLAPGSMGEKGPVVADAVVNVLSTISIAMSKFAEAELERAVRFQSQPVYSRLSPAQNERENGIFHERLAREQTEAIQKIKDQRIDEGKQKEVLDYLSVVAERMGKKITEPTFKQRRYPKVPKPEVVIPIEFEKEGLSDEQVEFLQYAASEAAALKIGEDAYEQGSDRWKDRFERAKRYWKDENVRQVYAKVKLSDSAKRMFRLPDLKSDSFENYEIVSVANQLSRDGRMIDHFREMYVSMALRQAHHFAEEGDLFASSKMVENALADRDFAHGTVKGLFQNVRDTFTGLWHLVRHPIESAKALANAIINFVETVEIISGKLDKILTEFPYYDEQKKGEVLGYLATEIAMAVGTGGLSLTAEVSKIAKVSEAVAIATEEAFKTLNAVNKIDPYLIQKVGDIYRAPKVLKAFPDAEMVKPKSYVQGGGVMRKRWYDHKTGHIFEWDSRHGRVEIYQGKKHLGEYDPLDGRQIKAADPERRLKT